jgi:hypothetical protein
MNQHRRMVKEGRKLRSASSGDTGDFRFTHSILSTICTDILVSLFLALVLSLGCSVFHAMFQFSSSLFFYFLHESPMDIGSAPLFLTLKNPSTTNSRWVRQGLDVINDTIMIADHDPAVGGSSTCDIDRQSENSPLDPRILSPLCLCLCLCLLCLCLLSLSPLSLSPVSVSSVSVSSVSVSCLCLLSPRPSRHPRRRNELTVLCPLAGA